MSSSPRLKSFVQSPWAINIGSGLLIALIIYAFSGIGDKSTELWLNARVGAADVSDEVFMRLDSLTSNALNDTVCTWIIRNQLESTLGNKRSEKNDSLASLIWAQVGSWLKKVLPVRIGDESENWIGRDFYREFSGIYDGLYYLQVVNGADLQVDNVRLKLPKLKFARISRQGMKAEFHFGSAPIELGSIAARDSITVTGWAEGPLTYGSFSGILLTHKSGVGEIRGEYPVSLFWYNLATKWPYYLFQGFLIIVLAVTIWFQFWVHRRGKASSSDENAV